MSPSEVRLSSLPARAIRDYASDRDTMRWKGMKMRCVKRLWASLVHWATYQPSQHYMRGGR